MQKNYNDVMVYIEVVFFNNLAIDVFLVFNCLLFRKRKLSKIRIAFSSIIGAIFACVYLFVPNYLQIVTKILLAPLMSVIFDKYTTFKDYIISTATFICLTYLFGGVVFGMQNLLGIDLTKYLLLAIIILSFVLTEIIVVKLIKTASKRHKIFKNATVFCGVDKCEFRALYDSGNGLFDSVSGLPVVVLSKYAQNKLNALDNLNSENFAGLISAKTVLGNAEMPVYFVDKIVVENDEYNCLIALSDKDFDDCEIILHNSMIGGKRNENKRTFSKDFKIIQR